jgi:hypothetical protein
MNLATDPAIAAKIARMAERVRFRDPQIRALGIDQTRLVLGDGDQGEEPAFSFLVSGDSGTGRHRRHSPPRAVADRLLEHRDAAAFLLHTGDVVYLVGARDQYPRNFIRPYREWLVGDEPWRSIPYDGMVFRKPFLPVPGNHDYYDLGPLVSVVAAITLPIRRWLQWFHDIDTGWRGSHQGETYSRAFLDMLAAVPPQRLRDHLDRHYSGRWDDCRCLRYEPGRFTRLPNRYYQFRHAGVDVFALDSNTFNAPFQGALATAESRSLRRRQLRRRIQELEEEQARCWRDRLTLSDEDARDDSFALREELEESLRDARWQLQLAGDGAEPRASVDHDQLDWLRRRLIASWRDGGSRGRILVFHHPPYVTEATKWDQGQTLAVRHHLRAVLDDVAAAVGPPRPDRPLVDLVLNGHAHCLEILHSVDTGHGDAHVPWVVCGGSGYSLRRQRREGGILSEPDASGAPVTVAESALFVGRERRRGHLVRPYSALRVDVAAGRPLAITLTPLITERRGSRWHSVDHPGRPARPQG